MFNSVESFFNISTLNDDAKTFIIRTSSIHYLFCFLISFANMFILLQAVHYVSKADVAFLLGVYLFVESIFAFPAGALGDFKSFRVVLSLSVFFYLITYQIVVIAKTFEQFLAIYVLLGISTAFHLENFFSYFDNNYDYYAYEDTNRAIYSEFLGKSVAIKFLVTALGIFIGAYVSSIFSRADLFIFSSLLLFITLLLTIQYLKDHQDFQHKKETNKDNFLIIMADSIKFSWQNRTIRFFIIGVVIAGITSVLWNEFFAISLFSSIGKTDQYVGLLLSSEIIMTAILTGLLGIVAGRVTRLKFWYLFTILLTYITAYFGLSIFLAIDPIPHAFQLSYLMLFVLVYFIVAIPFNFNYILYYRTILDLFPEKYRGSIYSLISSLKSISGSIIFFIAGAYLISISYVEDFIIIGLIGFLGSLIIFFSLYKSKLNVTIKEPIGFLSSFLVNTKTGFESVFLLSQHSKLSKFKSRIDNIVKELTKIALVDSQISEEEKEFIDVIMTDIQAYYSMIYDFESNTNFDPTEKEELLKVQKNNILKHAYSNLSNNTFDENLTKIVEKLQDIVATI